MYCWCQTLEDVVSPRDNNNTHTIMFDPNYNMMPPFFATATAILLIKNNLKFESRYESNRSLRCHVTTLSLWKVSQSPPPPVTKMRVPVFAVDWACEIELRQTGVICFPWRTRSWSWGVFKNWISEAHCPFQWKWQVLHNYDISVLHQFGMFSMGSPAWWRFGLCSSPGVQAGVPSCLGDVTWRECANFKCDVANVNK